MEKYFLGFSVRSFPRIQNKQADVLVKAAAENDPLPPDVFFEIIKSSSVNCAEEPAKFQCYIKRRLEVQNYGLPSRTFYSR